MSHWQDTENSMVLPHAEPSEKTPKPEDDGGEGRQRDTDTAKEITNNLMSAFDDIFKDEKLRTPFPTTERNGKF